MQLNSLYIFLTLYKVLAVIIIIFHILAFFPELRTSNDIVAFLLGVAALFSFFYGLKSNQSVVNSSEGVEGWNIVFKGIPIGLKVFMFLLVPYIAFNFFYTLLYLTGGLFPDRVNEVYVLMNKGEIVREISDIEYFERKAYVFRGFSGHFIFFQIFSIALLKSSLNRRINSRM